MPDKLPTIPQIVRALITLDDRHDDERARMEERNKVQAAVIKWLSDMLAEILRQANNADQDSVFLEPTEIARLAKVDVPNLLRNELHRLRARRGHEQAQESTEAENGPQTAAQAVLCTKCGKDGPAHFMWAQGHVPEFPRDLDPRIVEARKGLRQGETHAAVECECGTIWSDGVIGAGHNDMDCTQADPNQAKLAVMRAQGEIEALRSQLSQARAQARNAIGREEWYANAVNRLRDKFGRDAVEPIVKATRLAYDFNRLTPEQQEKAKEDGYVPENAPEDGTSVLEDICTCGHKRHQHLRSGAYVGCTACVVRGLCHFFMLAVR